MTWLRYATTLALLVSSASAQAYWEKPDPIMCDPRTETSSDGVWSLRIEPNDRAGETGTQYRLRRDGIDVWSGTLPVYLREAFVAKTGTFVGLGMLGDDPANPWRGKTHLIVVRADGALLLSGEDPALRAPSPRPLGAPVSATFDVLIPLEDEDRFVVRFGRWESGSTIERWRLHRLSTGERLDVISPQPEWLEARGRSSPLKRSSAEPVSADPLEPLGTIDLTAGDPPRSPAHDFTDFVIDDEGRFLLVRRINGSEECDLVRMGADGRLVDQVRLRIAEPDNGRWSGELCWTHGDRVILGRHPQYLDQKLVETSFTNGECRDLETQPHRLVRGMERTPDGGFIVMGQNELLAFDRDTKLKWRRTMEDGLCGALSFTLAPDGQLALFDHPNGKNPAVQLVRFDGKVGRYRRLSDVPEGQLDRLWFDARGAWLMTYDDGYDVRDDFSLPMFVYVRDEGAVRVDEHGECDDKFVLRGPDKRRLNPDCIRAAPDGSVWLSSRGSLYRMSADWKVERTLGDAADEVALRVTSLISVSDDGTIHALNARTGTVFVSNADGKRLRVLRSDPDDFHVELDPYGARLEVRADGSVLVGHADSGIVEFERDGRRKLRRDFGALDRGLLQAGTDRRWVVNEDISLIDAKGTLVHRTTKRSDGGWLIVEDEPARALDGSIAAATLLSPRPNRRMAVEILRRDGAPQRTIPLEEEWLRTLAWDGERVAYLTGGRLHVIHAATSKHREFSVLPAGLAESHFGPMFFVRGGRELWIFDGRSQIHRIRTPTFE